ncbi:hypothetical protein ACOMHN_037538 [Nucella lapillus]
MWSAEDAHGPERPPYPADVRDQVLHERLQRLSSSTSLGDNVAGGMTTHDDMVLYLIELRRDQARLLNARDRFRNIVKKGRASESDYRKQTLLKPHFTPIVNPGFTVLHFLSIKTGLAMVPRHNSTTEDHYQRPTFSEVPDHSSPSKTGPTNRSEAN